MVLQNLKPPKIGDKFERLTVTDGPYKREHGIRIYWVVCVCGTEKEIQKHHLYNTKSCGCLKKELTDAQHAAANPNTRYKHPLYNIWKSMIRRCEVKTDKDYYAYGGRGIKVCKEWHDFEKFVVDMSPRTSLNHSLDRIDNDGPYNKANCRWATKKEQCTNRIRKGLRRINTTKQRVSADPPVT